MSIQWERLCGDTSKLAVKVAFSPDPDEGQGIDADVAVSWGGFQIWVEGKNLCAHQEQGERIDYAHWYLLPLLEWLAKQWNPLLHEERLPSKNAAATAWASLRETRFPPPAIEMEEDRAQAWESEWQGWWTRHALRATQDGGLFPDVVFRRCRDTIEISWGNTPRQGMPPHFVFDGGASGWASLEPRQVAESLHEVLSGASEYLTSLAPDSDRIRKLSQQIRALRTPRKEERLGWLAGLGVDGNTVQQGWARVKRYLSKHPQPRRSSMLAVSGDSRLVVEGACQAALMFGTVAPEIQKEDVLQLADVMIKLHEPAGDRCQAPINSMCRAVPVDDFDGSPWLQGYKLAEEVHEQLSGRMSNETAVDIDRLVAELGVQVTELNLTDETIRGVAIAGPRYQPGIGCNQRNHFNAHLFGRRFTLAHELCHLLFDRSAGQRLALASGPWAPLAIERRANAFAAMLLMPTHLVQRAISRLNEPLETQAGVTAVASRLQSGYISTLNHLENLGFIDEDDERRIQAERYPQVH